MSPEKINPRFFFSEIVRNSEFEIESEIELDTGSSEEHLYVEFINPVE